MILKFKTQRAEVRDRMNQALCGLKHVWNHAKCFFDINLLNIYFKDLNELF